MRNSRQFWTGFVAGAASAGAAWLAWVAPRMGRMQVERIEKSIQIGRRPDEVFALLQDPQRLVGMLPELQAVQVNGNRQLWKVRLGVESVAWEHNVVQVHPGQSLGWRSVRGPKHTGRINIAPVGDQTEVHLILNYVPRLWMTPSGEAPAVPGAHLELKRDGLARAIEDGLLHFKHALEDRGFERDAALRPGADQITA